MRIDHLALYCRDLEGMRQFFIDHFSAVSNEQYHNPRTGLRTYILTFPDGGARLEIMQRPDTVDSKTAELAGAGYRVASGPRTTGDGYYESCIIGPEGIQIEITV